MTNSQRLPYLSVVIPIFNEEKTIPFLMERLNQSLEGLGYAYEVIFVNDGSHDQSLMLLRQAFEADPQHIRVVDLTYNVGQYMALMAGLQHTQGEVIVTMDADLQNPPEEIGRLLEKIHEGYDLVGGYRARRKDTLFRRRSSEMINRVREYLTGLKMKDHGCMLRAYRRSIVDAMNRTQDPSIFINALAQKFANKAIDIEVRHEPRYADKSRYNLFGLIRLFMDLLTGFSLRPIQAFTGFGFLSSGFSFVLVIILGLRRIILGPEAEGLFTLFAILFFLISVALVGIGLVGEYVGRIYLAVSKRPRYLVRETLGDTPQDKEDT